MATQEFKINFENVMDIKRERDIHTLSERVREKQKYRGYNWH